MRSFVVIPAYNEQGAIGTVIQSVKCAGYDSVIVVDDGSEDATKKIAERSGALVIRHALNRGKGAAIRTGIEVAKQFQADIVVTMDADGQHQADDIHKLIAPIQAKQCDVVLGVRKFDPSVMPVHKLIANYLANAVIWILYRVWVPDTQSGFRAFSKRAIELIDTHSDRYEYDSEIIHEIHWHELIYLEVPICVHYTPYSQNKADRQHIISGLQTLARLFWQAIS